VVIGYVTDGTIQANIVLRSTLSFTSGLTLTYTLNVPERDVSINLSLNVSDITQPTSTINVNLTMSGPNGVVALSGQFTETGGTLNVLVNGDLFATITTSGTTTTITRTDGQPLTDDENAALGTVFEHSNGAFTAFDQMLAPVGAFFTEPA